MVHKVAVTKKKAASSPPVASTSKTPLEKSKKEAAAKSKPSDAYAQNLMIFCDGTGDNALDEERAKTNVYRLFQCVANFAPGKASEVAPSETEVDGSSEEEDDDAESDIEFADDDSVDDDSVDNDPEPNTAPQFGHDRGQITFYQRGIGTKPELGGTAPRGYSGGQFEAAQRSLQKMKIPSVTRRGDQMFGKGIEANIATLYYIVCTSWRKGDKLFLFGFSRGGYTVRLLSALLLDIGIFDFRGEKLPAEFDTIEGRMLFCGKVVTKWGKYREKVLTEGTNIPAVKEYFTPLPSIEVVGCWDTVGAIKKGSVGGFIGTGWDFSQTKWEFAERLRDGVKNAFQAFALTERRNDFKPVVWKEVPQGTNMKQCWFVGNHSAIGGNQKHPEINIGNHTLVWMLSQVHELMGIDATQLAEILSTSEPGAPDITDSIKGIWKARGAHLRDRDVGSGVEEYIHESVRLFTKLTRITSKGPFFKKILATKVFKANEGYHWVTTEGARTVKEDKPNSFERKRLKSVRAAIEEAGHFSAKGKETAEDDPEGDAAAAESDDNEEVPTKTPSGKPIEKTLAGGNAKAARDPKKAPPVSGMKVKK